MPECIKDELWICAEFLQQRLERAVRFAPIRSLIEGVEDGLNTRTQCEPHLFYRSVQNGAG